MTDTPDTADFVVRLPKESTFAMTPDAVSILAQRTEQSLIDLLAEPKHFLSRLDEDGHDLLLHSIAKKLDPVHHWRVIDFIFELPPFFRTIQDSDKNSVLHYLAQQGVDVLRHRSPEDFVYRNKYGNTPLHWLAKDKDFHERIYALPFRILSVQNGMGLSVLDVMEKVRAASAATDQLQSILERTQAIAASPLRTNKLDTSDASLSEFTFGFEFEFCSKFRHEYIAEILHLSKQKVGVVTDEYGIHKHAGYTSWHVTGDPTIETDSPDEYMVELISPVLRVEEVGPTLNLVWRILHDTGAYTNDSCGLHINIGHLGGGLTSKDFNPIKLALFLEDDRILRSMGRDTNLECQAFLSYVRGVVHADLRSGFKHIIGPYETPALPEKLRDHKTNKHVPIDYDVVTIVDKIAHDPKTRLRLSNSFDKNISINLTKLSADPGDTPIIEYRAPGNEWSSKSPRQFEGIARKLAAAAKVAMDPNALLESYRALIVRDILHGQTPTEHEFIDDSIRKELFGKMA